MSKSLVEDCGRISDLKTSVEWLTSKTSPDDWLVYLWSREEIEAMLEYYKLDLALGCIMLDSPPTYSGD